jgi:SAM-dependent methyltransferase
MRDPVAFSSAQLPTEHFNARFSEESIAFSIPVFIDCARIEAGHRVLDIGCGTGGFTRAIAALTGNDSALPTDGAFDRAVLSLVLHQLAQPELAVAEAFRSLAADGRVVVRTAAPEDVAARVPYRFFPSMSAVDTVRMPPLDEIEGWLRDAGFVVVERRWVPRNKKLSLAEEERNLLVEFQGRYSFIPEAERDAGLRLMHAEARASPAGWIDLRPTSFIIASKTD